MNTVMKTVLALGTVSMLSAGSLAITTIPAAAYVQCDEDGDDCYRVRPYYGRDWREDRYARHEWREQREREEAYRRWYWRHRSYDYGYRQPYGSSLWFNF